MKTELSIYIEMADWNIDSDDRTETRVWIKGSRFPKFFYFIHRKKAQTRNGNGWNIGTETCWFYSPRTVSHLGSALFGAREANF